MSQQGPLTDFSSAGSDIETLTGNTGGPVGPDGAFNINILGGDTTTITGDPGTNTLTVDSSVGGYPITPYVVGPSGQAGYTTIQSAIDAATLAGRVNMIWVQPGTYTEDLNITSSITLQGSDGEPTIVGVHTPPTSGTVNFDGFVLVTATDVLNSAAAGTTTFNINNCFVVITDGYIFNLPNWTGELLMDNCVEASTEDGVVNNVTGSSTIKFLNVEMGAGSKVMELNGDASGFLRFDTCNVNCPVNMQGAGDVFFQNGVKFANSVTIGGSLTGFAIDTNFRGGAAQALTFNSTGNFSISNGEIQSTNNPALGGTGTGTLTLTSIGFPDDNNIAGTLTIAGGNSYSATYKSDYTDHGVILGQGATTNMVATAAGSNGELLIGATGADPAFASLTSSGGTVTFTPGANSLNLEAGGGTVANSYPTDSGTATPAAGVLTLAGGTNVNTSGAGSNATVNLDANVLGLTQLTVDNLELNGNTLSSTDVNGDVIIAPNGSGTISVTAAPIVPSTDRADSLGSATNSWDNVYADGLTFDDGSNIMSAYETGSWTPVLEFGGASVGITYSNQSGTYTRIGNFVFIRCVFNLTNKGSSTGNATITGLPFASVGDVYWNLARSANITLTSSAYLAYVALADSSTTLIIQEADTSGTASGLSDVDFANNSILTVTGGYFA